MAYLRHRAARNRRCDAGDTGEWLLACAPPSAIAAITASNSAVASKPTTASASTVAASQGA